MTRSLAYLVIASLTACGAVPPPSTSAPAAAPGVIATVPIGRGPTRLAMSPDGSVLYAASMAKLTAIRTATNTTAVAASIDPYTSGLAVTPDGRSILLIAASSSTLKVLPSDTLTGGSTISLPQNLQPGGYGRIAVSPDGTAAVVVNEALWLAIVDLGAGSARRRLLDMRPCDVALSPDGATAYVAGCKRYCTTGTIEGVAVASGDVATTFAVGPAPHRIALAPDGRHAYTTDLGGPSLSVIDLAGGPATATTLAVGVEPTGLAVSPDGTRVYVANHQSKTLTVARGDGRSVLATVPLAGKPREVVLSPDGRRAYVSTMSPDAIVVLDAQRLVAVR